MEHRCVLGRLSNRDRNRSWLNRTLQSEEDPTARRASQPGEDDDRRRRIQHGSGKRGSGSWSHGRAEQRTTTSGKWLNDCTDVGRRPATNDRCQRSICCSTSSLSAATKCSPTVANPDENRASRFCQVLLDKGQRSPTSQVLLPKLLKHRLLH